MCQPERPAEKVTFTRGRARREKPFTCSSYQPAELLLALKNSALENLSVARAHSHARAEFSGTLVSRRGRAGACGGRKKAVGRNASPENTQSNQDKVDVKVARRRRPDKNDIYVRWKV